MNSTSSGDVHGASSTSNKNHTATVPARRLFSDTIEMPTHPPDVVAHLEPALNIMRRAREYCDVVFQTTDGMETRAHRFVLKSRYPGCGTFFARENKLNTVGSKFQSPSSEQQIGRQHRNEWPAVAKIYVSDLSFEMLEIVIDVAYRVPLRERVGPHNVREVLEVAEALSIAEIRDYCLKLLKEILEVNNCIGSYQLAVKKKYADLERTAFRYILRNFDKIWTASPEFQSLTFEHLQDMLRDDELHVAEEIEGTFGAILKWIEGNAPKRRAHLAMLLKLVRFSFCGRADVYRVRNVPEVQADKTAIEFLDLVKAVLTIREMHGRHDRLCTYPWLRPRLPRDILFTFGGWAGRVTNDLMTYNYRSRRWQVLANQRTPPRVYHDVAVLEGLAYFVGGYDGRNYYSTVVCLDVARKKWTEKANMNKARGFVSVAVLDGRIYAMGGFDGRRPTDSCERYDSARNEWDFVAPMHEARVNAGAVTAAGHIYVLGGFTTEQVLNSVERYDPVADTWTQVHGMLTPRNGPKVVVRDDVLYVVGGRDGFQTLSSAEKLDVRSGEWTQLPAMSHPRSNCAAVLFQECVYVAGGFDFDTMGTMSSVERYDIEARQWHRIPGLSAPRSAAAAWISHDVPDPKYWLPDQPYEDDDEEEEEEEDEDEE